MNIRFTSSLARVFDFFRVIVCGYNHQDYFKQISEMGITCDEEIINAFHYVWEDLDKTTPGLALFFTINQGQYCYLTSKFDRLLWKFRTIDSFINYFNAMDRTGLQRGILAYYDTRERDLEYYDNLIDNPGLLFEFVNGLDVSVTLKWEMVSFINEPETVMNPLISFFNIVKTKINTVYENNSAKIKRFKKQMAHKINQPGESFLISELGEFEKQIDFSEYEEILITFSLFNEVIIYTTSYKTRLCIYLGINYEKTRSHHRSNFNISRLLNIFKALADQNRLLILEMLLNKEMFVSEIAGVLDIRISTVSYHLDLLQMHGLLQSRIDGRQVFYTANKELIKQWIHLLAEELDGEFLG